VAFVGAVGARSGAVGGRRGDTLPRALTVSLQLKKEGREKCAFAFVAHPAAAAAQREGSSQHTATSSAPAAADESPPGSSRALERE